MPVSAQYVLLTCTHGSNEDVRQQSKTVIGHYDPGRPDGWINRKCHLLWPGPGNLSSPPWDKAGSLLSVRNGPARYTAILIHSLYSPEMELFPWKHISAVSIRLDVCLSLMSLFAICLSQLLAWPHQRSRSDLHNIASAVKLN